ncbi:hypothetical protein [Streptomyces cellulosae]|uniref:Uncharacterized protein n=1 Tax=Streptomyces cellulosae TaxID=1968 RepID=A0ABW7XZI6_STRCE
MAPSTSSAAAASPTDGWSRTGGVHRMWVNGTGEPPSRGGSTGPHTGLRRKQEYTYGQRRRDADVYPPSGTNGATFAQILRVIHPEGTPATDFTLTVHSASGGTVKAYDGTVKAYDGTVKAYDGTAPKTRHGSSRAEAHLRYLTYRTR